MTLDGGLTALKYAGCALSIAASTTLFGAIAAVVSCSALFYGTDDASGG